MSVSFSLPSEKRVPAATETIAWSPPLTRASMRAPDGGGTTPVALRAPSVLPPPSATDPTTHPTRKETKRREQDRPRTVTSRN
jgi:hypothetical protein